MFRRKAMTVKQYQIQQRCKSTVPRITVQCISYP